MGRLMTMSEQSRRRTWQPVVQTKERPNNCAVCGRSGASYSIDGVWNWHCWVCVPDESYFKAGDKCDEKMY